MDLLASYLPTYSLASHLRYDWQNHNYANATYF